jgi:hypothetical protein
MDSRRYRKICAALAAARWRLRFVVGVCRVAPVQPFQTAKRSGLIGQSPLPERYIAATGKISTELAGNTMATALFGGGLSVAPVQPFQTAKRSGPIGQSPLPERDSRRYRRDLHGIGRRHDGDCALWWGTVSCSGAAFPDC